jgi:hypothetical protein
MRPNARAVFEGLSGAAATQPGAFLLPLWAGLAQGTITFEDFGAAVRARRGLTYLTIDTTGACDLKCTGMCYYNPDISLQRPLVSEVHLARAIHEATQDLSLHLLAFAGKEPFLNHVRLFSLMREAGSIPDRQFSIGIVTNGRHVARHADSLLAASAEECLDYIDVSIDTADASAHDLFRGLDGTHERAVSAVRWLNAEIPDVRTTVVSVLRWDNQQGILDLLRALATQNASYQIQPIQPPPYSTIRPFPADYITGFLTALVEALSGPLAGAKIQVSIELLGIYLLEAVQAGFFAWSDLKEDENSTIFVERSIGGNTLIITCELFPLQAWRLARITYTGAYLAHMHFLQSPDPDQYAVGNVGHETISALFDRAMAPSSHFGQVLQSRSAHDCIARPCWSNCFGGWNGAENSFVEKGRKLSEQPRLCTKVSEDFVRLEAAPPYAGTKHTPS